MTRIPNPKQDFWKTCALGLGAILILSLAGNIWLLQKTNFDKAHNIAPPSLLEANVATTQKVSAKEIYSLFECPCCGSSIAECTCPMAKERKNYVDATIETSKDSSNDEIILAYVKKYGLDSFIDKEIQEEFREKLAREAPANRPIISLTPDSYDFGDISQKGGMVTTFFELGNEGRSDLIIERLETSCGCTSAAIVYQGEEGPKFSMPGHNVNEEIEDWQVVIPPGEKAGLKVYYDPNVHPDFRGPAIREIYVFSNDPIDFEKKVSIELNQVD